MHGRELVPIQLLEERLDRFHYVQKLTDLINIRLRESPLPPFCGLGFVHL